MYVCQQISKHLKMDGFINAFVGCNLFNMYTKGGSKKIWHEMIIFVCDSKSYIKMNKYNIISIFLGLILVMFEL